MRMLALFIANRYIGTMLSTVVYTVVERHLKSGEVATAHHLDYMDEPSAIATTYLHNGDFVRIVDHTPSKGYWCQDCTDYHDEEWDSPTFQEPEQIQPRLRTKTYRNHLSTYKYTVSMARNMQHASGAVTHIKREMRRAERRVGKKLIEEQLASMGSQLSDIAA